MYKTRRSGIGPFDYAILAVAAGAFGMLAGPATAGPPAFRKPTGAVPPAPMPASPTDDRRVVRVSINDLPLMPAAARSIVDAHFDTCAIDRDPDGSRHAVLFLPPADSAALSAAWPAVEDCGTLADHVARFAPLNTLARKRIPSLERYPGVPVGPSDDSQYGVPFCGVPRTSLMPYDEYHTMTEGVCFLRDLCNAHPTIARLESLGTSIEGRSIWAVRISDNVDAIEPGEERILFTGVTHAREWATHEMMLFLAEYLITRYDRDPRVRHIVDNSVVWLIPVVNPDGFHYSWTVNRMWRKNRRDNPGTCDGVDINRNYDYRWAYDNSGSSGSYCSETYRGTAAASEPETRTIQKFLNAERPAIAVSYHTYSQLVLYAWGYTGLVAPESYTSLRAIGKRYADLVYAVGGQLYVPGQSNYTIYPTNGDFDDYAYGAAGLLSFTPELRPASSAQGGFLLPESQILPNNEENTAAALWLMENVADAVTVSNSASKSLVESPQPDGIHRVALPLTPVNQKPALSLAYPAGYDLQLRTLLNDSLHNPPYYGVLNIGYEGCGAGSGYLLHTESYADLLKWAVNTTSYKALPHVFDNGAEVLLSNVTPGINVIGVPSARPVDLRDVRVIKRIIGWTGNTFGYGEIILEERTALADLASPAPWLDWSWVYFDPAGGQHVSHPTGPDPFVQPFRAYEVRVNVASWNFPSSSELGAVYLLRFPAATLGSAAGP